MALNDYIPIIKFIGEFLGSDAEVILYDAIEGNVAFVHNPMDPELQEGSVRCIEKQMIDQRLYETKEAIMNYRTISADRKNFRSGSHFIKDTNRNLVGIISINYKIDELLNHRNILNHLISGSGYSEDTHAAYFKNRDFTFKELMDDTIQEVLVKYHVPPERLSQEEKIDLIGKLEEKGVFMMKGSVSELAKILHSSEASVYRYINKINPSDKEPF